MESRKLLQAALLASSLLSPSLEANARSLQDNSLGTTDAIQHELYNLGVSNNRNCETSLNPEPFAEIFADNPRDKERIIDTINEINLQYLKLFGNDKEQSIPDEKFFTELNKIDKQSLNFFITEIQPLMNSNEEKASKLLKFLISNKAAYAACLRALGYNPDAFLK